MHTTQSLQPHAAPKRLLALDVMRGMTIAGMIMVNDPGSWSYIYAPLRHAAWNGLTPTDLIFPFFMFIMGISTYFSLRKFEFRQTRTSLYKILKRTLLIFLVGLAINLFVQQYFNPGASLAHLRIPGVMQRLALAYGIASLLLLHIPHKYLLHLSAGLLLFYALLLHFTGSTSLTPDNIAILTDKALLGENHLYTDYLPDGTPIIFDPEGLLGCISSTAHVLIGAFTGMQIARYKNSPEQVIRPLFLTGTLLLFCGLLLSYGCPLNKKIWSSTFVLTTCGFGSLLLALLIWNIDINSHQRWTRFFEVFGINPLYLYVQSAFLSVLLSSCKPYAYEHFLAPVFGAYGGSLAWAVLFVLLNWLPGYWLYRKQIYIKL